MIRHAALAIAFVSGCTTVTIRGSVAMTQEPAPPTTYLCEYDPLDQASVVLLDAQGNYVTGYQWYSTDNFSFELEASPGSYTLETSALSTSDVWGQPRVLAVTLGDTELGVSTDSSLDVGTIAVGWQPWQFALFP